MKKEWETNGFWKRMKELTGLKDDKEIGEAISYIDWALKSNILLKFALTSKDFLNMQAFCNQKNWAKTLSDKNFEAFTNYELFQQFSEFS